MRPSDLTAAASAARQFGAPMSLFPDSIHVFDTGLARFTSDEAIWECARSSGFVIVTADSDFLGIAEERGTPPKIVRLDNCNYRTARVEDLLRRNAVRISELEHSPRPVLTIRNT
jgi:predicted nuclease of predicted toxin-antitoxin system